MIIFDKKQNVIRLDNGSILYLIYINSEGYLETVYFGKRINEFDVSLTRPMGGEESTIYSISENRSRIS